MHALLTTRCTAPRRTYFVRQEESCSTLRPRRSSSLWMAMEETHLLTPPSLQHQHMSQAGLPQSILTGLQFARDCMMVWPPHAAMSCIVMFLHVSCWRAVVCEGCA